MGVILSEPDYFQLFFKIYPKPTGIGAARAAWATQIFFHSADPQQIYEATKAYRAKHRDTESKFIPNPSRYLNDQTYLDPDLQNFVEKKVLTGWRADLCRLIGVQRFRFNEDNSDLIDGILYLDMPLAVVDVYRNKFQVEFKLCGIKEIKKREAKLLDTPESVK